MPAFKNLAQFLETFPGIHFDAAHYLLSYKYKSLLRERLTDFQSSLGHTPSQSEQKALIVEAVRTRLSADVPAYAGLESIDKFEVIPLMGKEELRAAAAAYISRRAAGTELWRRDTSGTTGPPLPIFFCSDYYFDDLFLSTRKLAILAREPGSDAGFVYCIATTDTRSHRNEAFVDPTRDVGLTLRVLVDHQEPQTVRDFFTLIDATRPRLLSLKPSVLEVLVARADLRMAASYFPRFVICAGSHLGESLRAEFERTFDTRVYDCYGLAEFGTVGFECSARNGLHLFDPSILVELLDREGGPVGEGGEGELTLSSVANDAMPLLRYRTGDLAIVDSSPCPCGLPGRRIRDLLGRLAFCFRFPTGEFFSPTHLNNLFTFFPIREFQVTQTAAAQLVVLVEPDSDCGNTAAMLHDIRDHLGRVLPGGIRVSVAQTQFDSRHKFERFKSLVKG